MKCGIIIPAKIQGFELSGVNCNSLPRPSWELYQTVSKVENGPGREPGTLEVEL